MSTWEEIDARRIELDFADYGNDVVADLLDDSGSLIAEASRYLPWHPIKARRLRREARRIHVRVRLIQYRVDDVLKQRRSMPNYMRLDDLL